MTRKGTGAPQHKEVGLIASRDRREQRTFQEKLQGLGFPSYDDYLRSDQWMQFKEKFRRSGLPQDCVGCQGTPIELHHRNYGRIGHESLRDVLPLCRDCHRRVHEYAKEHQLGVFATPQILQALHGWTDLETDEKFAPFRDVNRKIGTHSINVSVRTHVTIKEFSPRTRKRRGIPQRPNKTAVRREAARYAYGVLASAFAKDSPKDGRVYLAVQELIQDLKQRGRVQL